MSTIAMNCRRRLLGGAAVGLCAPAVVLAQTALAQQQDPGALQPVDEAEELEEIVVTGSRIRRSNLDMPVPVMSVDAEDILRSGETDIGNLLQEIPSLIGSVTTDTSNVIGAATGTSTLNLRNLGTERTLVVVNGRRHIAGIVGEQTVDINTIPTALVERVDVLTGGASAIYGADAVTGVVNFILKDDFEGVDIRSQAGISDEGDAEDYFVSVTAGGNFGDGRGNAWVNAEFNRNRPVFQPDRVFAAGGPVFDFDRGVRRDEEASEVTNTPDVQDFFGTDPDAAVSFQPNETFAISSAAGRITIPLAAGGALEVGPNGEPLPGGDFFFGGLFFNGPGTLRNFDPGLAAGGANGIGGDGIPNITNLGILTPETDQLNVNANVKYEFMPELRLFMETKFSFSDTQSGKGGVNTFNDFIPIQGDNPFIPTELQSVIDDAAAAGLGPGQILITRDQLDRNVANTSDADRLTIRVVTGFEGDIGTNWNYELSYNYGRAEADVANSRNRVEDRFFAAVDAVALSEDDIAGLPVDAAIQAVRPGVDEAMTITGRDAQVGDIVCRSSIDPEAEPPVASFPTPREGFLTFDPGPGSPCVPVNIFGANTISQAAADFIWQRTVNDIQLEQHVVSGFISGDTSGFFELPHGPISLVAGGEFRREESRFFPDSLNENELIFAGGTMPTTGAFDVGEGFAEVSIPVLADLPFAQQLTVDGAVRLSDYSTIGHTTAWKAVGLWEPTQDIRIRGGFSRAVRAPNVTELFQPQTVAFFFPDDPCDEDFIGAGTQFREQNCRALGIPEGFDDPNTARFEGVSGGNPDLAEEEADTFWIGGVITPRWIPNLSVSIDFYDIEITDAISTIDAQEIVDNCVDAPTLNNEFCELQQRDPGTLALSFIEQVEQNVAAFETRGIDFQVRYTQDLADLGLDDWGSLTFNVVGSHVLDRTRFQFQRFPDEPTREDGSFFDPEWAVNMDTTWNWQALSLSYQLRFQSSQLLPGLDFEEIAAFQANNPGLPFADPQETGNAFVHDINVNYQLLDDLRVYFGVNNLADRDPFRASVTRPVSGIGRFFFGGFTLQY